MVSIVVYHGEPGKNIHFEIWRRLTPSTRGPKFLRKTPFLGPFITLVEELPWLFFADGNMTWHYKPPDSIQSHPRQSPDPSRHLPDTPQTPKIWALFVHIIPLGEKLAANKSNGMFMNCLHIIPPNHYPESLRQPPDTSQTPSKHPTDTPNLGKFWSSQGHWEKRKQLLRMSLMGCLISACIPFPRYYPKSTPRHLPKPTIKYDIFDQTETRI